MVEAIVKFVLVAAIVTCTFLVAGVIKLVGLPIIISYPAVLVLGVLGGKAIYEVVVA